MPEVPDLVVINDKLNQILLGRCITAVTIREPIVLRNCVDGPFESVLAGMCFRSIRRQGPFLVFALGPTASGPTAVGPGTNDPTGSTLQLIVHFMLAGRLQIQKTGDKAVAKICFSLILDNGQILNYADAKRMGKVYLTRPGETRVIPGFDDQGVDVLSSAFTAQLFRSLIEKKRNQARVFLMDQTRLSAIGNAYADEILFAAGLHPKTLCSQLAQEEIERFYRSIIEVLTWGIDKVRQADRPLEAKVRDHLRVRNRKGQPCPVCGTTIRRIGVLGYDSFFCPRCQPARRQQTIPWERQP